MQLCLEYLELKENVNLNVKTQIVNIGGKNMSNSDNKDFVSNKVNLPNDPSINVLNQNSQYKNSIQKQEENRRKKENVKSKIKTLIWFLGLIVLNVLFQVLGYYGNHDYYSGFEFNWEVCIWGSISYCMFSLIISALSKRAKNPEFYEAIDKARQKQIEEIKKQAEEDKKYIPKCPTCGCENVRKISSTERGVNAVMFGVYGTKRKCQFECQNPNCKYRW